MTSRRALLTCALLAVTSCSADAERGPVAPSPAPRLPDDGRWLQSLGIGHGPRLGVPRGLTPTRVTDSPNVVTLILAAADGPALVAWLRRHAVALGLSEVVASDDSMTFRLDGWDAGLTSTPTLAALTLRHRP